MSDLEALRIAVDLFRAPQRGKFLRAESLPSGMEALLRIAAGDDAAGHEVGAALDRPKDVIREAAVFFIEQILFAPGTDCYRVLGATPAATASELRRNMALLLKWLHPDLDHDSERAIYVNRVTGAWNNLKSPDRRAAYDALRKGSGENLKASPNGHRGSKSATRKVPSLRRRFEYDRKKLRVGRTGGGGFLWRAWLIILQKPYRP